MSVRTIALTLKPDEAQKLAFKRLQKQFSAACNYISQVAWEKQEFNKVRLQRFVYYDVRKQFGLKAEHTIRAIAVAAYSYKVDKAKAHSFRDDTAVVLGSHHAYSITGNRASILTLEGRANVELGIGGYQRLMLKDASKIGDAQLIHDHKGRWRLKVTAHFSDPPTHESPDVIGVDMGIRALAYDSDGIRYTGDKVLGLRARYSHMRRKLSMRHTASARKLRRKRSNRERRFQLDTNHCIAKELVERAARTGRGIALEDLRHLQSRLTVKKSQRQAHNGWSYRDLRAKITYKALAYGVRVIFIDPRYTSQTCSQCGHCERANRQSQSSFVCRSCGFAAHADLNAALVIRDRGRGEIMRPNILCAGVSNGARTSLAL